MVRFAAAVILLASCAPAQVTYSKEIARLMQAKCQQCHRPGDIAPFSLLNYEETATYARDIHRAVTRKIMPPWKPVEGFGQFRDSYGLSEEERRQMLDWIEAGAPEGDPAELPEPLPVSDSPWQLGEPDLKLTLPEFTPPEAPTDTYRCFVLPPGIDANRFVTASQSAPGNKQLVHHVLVYLDVTGAGSGQYESEKLDAEDEAPGYSCFGGPKFQLNIGSLIGGWAPGARARHLPEGIGLFLPKDARLVVQVHYNTSGGRIGSDQTQVGFWFAPPDLVRNRLVNIPLVNTTFTIPAGAGSYEVRAQQIVLPFLSGKAITIAPHMHLLGRKIQVEIDRPGSESQPMIRIDDWDFNWQGFYTFVEPMRLPPFSIVRLTATYDNSENNPKNPNNPLKPVRWGEGTEDEMCLAFIGVVFDNESLLPFSSGSRR